MLPGDWSSSLTLMYLVFGVASAMSATLFALSSRGFKACQFFLDLQASMSVSAKSVQTMTCHCWMVPSSTRGRAMIRKTLSCGSRPTVSILLILGGSFCFRIVVSI